MTRLIALLIAFLTLALIAPAARAQTTDEDTLEFGGLTRSYTLFLPSAAEDGARLPLMIALHGGGGSGRQFMRYTGFNELAEQAGFAVVYPDAVDHNWHDGRDFLEGEIDDIGFLEALIAHLTAQHPLDAERVFVTGMSNGGFMTATLGCLRPDLLAGIAIITAGLPEPLDGACVDVPLPMLIMNGTDDPLVPYDGGPVALGRGVTLSTAATLDHWRALNGCPDAPDVSFGIDARRLDGTSIDIAVYSECESGAAVVLYRVEGGGHTLPGAAQYAPRATIGGVSREIDGAAEIMEFFTGLAEG